MVNKWRWIDPDYKSLVTFLLFFTIAHCIAGFLFFQGFLLMRYEVPNKSECSLSPSPSLSFNDNNGCWLPATYKHAVILIIDALRFDFVYNNNNNNNNKNNNNFIIKNNYHNKLTVLHEMASQHPEHSFLFRFIADSPTTTMQRLKGLTTGSLPTFIDAGSNFGSSAIFEDNIIRQLYNTSAPEFRKKVYFYGDDTWASLFPDHFHENVSLPSFNVKDLHTVDQGVITNVIPSLIKKFGSPDPADKDLNTTANGNWDVLIGHMLGVDHVGHRHGPDHPAMKDKLEEMDRVIRKIISILESSPEANDTILFVMGDHGMTSSGDHGGASEDEINSALFVYSPRVINHSAKKKAVNESELYRKIPQIDFVPSFSLLLGVPIPYGNLGGIIPELFLQSYTNGADIENNNNKDKTWLEERQEAFWHLNSAMRINIMQIRRYLQTYSKISKAFPSHILVETDDKLSEANAIFEELEKARNSKNPSDYAELTRKHETLYWLYTRIQQGIIDDCRKVWATFDLEPMRWGMGLMALSCLGLVTCIFFDTSSSLSPSSSSFYFPFRAIWISVGVGSVGSLLEWIIRRQVSITLLGPPLLAAILGLMYCLFKKWFYGQTVTFCPLGPFPNKDAPCQRIIFLFSIFVVLAHAVGLFSNSYIEAQDGTIRFLSSSLLLFYLVILLKEDNLPTKLLLKCFAVMAVIRFTLSSWSLTSAAVSIGNKESFVSSDQLFKNALLMWFWCLPVLFYILRRIVLSIMSSESGCAQTQREETHASTQTQEKTHAQPQKLPAWAICAQATVFVGLVAIGCFWILQQSQMVDSLSWWQKSLSPWISYASSIIGMLICFIPGSGEKNRGNTEFDKHQSLKERNILFLRLTLFVANLGTTVLLLSGPNCVQNIVMLFAQCILFCQLSHHLRGCAIHSVLLWGFFTLQYYFATGHDFSFTRIQWSSAYIGFEEMNFARSAILTIINTFSSPIIFTFLLPILVLYSRGISSSSSLSSSPSSPSSSPESAAPLSVFVYLRMPFLMYMLFFSVTATSTIAFVYFAREHLMVWRVFAPKYIFETCFLLVVDWSLVACACVVQSFVKRSSLSVYNKTE